LRRAVNDDLTELVEGTRRIASQTHLRIAGISPDGATRRVSLHDGCAPRHTGGTVHRRVR